MNFALAEKNIIVTGTSGGIGFATASLLAELGARVICLSRKEGKIQSLKEKFGFKIEFHACDFSKNEGIKKVIPLMPAEIHGLVVNAAYFEKKPFVEISLEEWHNYFEVNVTQAFLLVRALWENLARAYGSVVFVSSLAGLSHIEKFAGASAYTATKMALSGLGEVIAVEGKAKGIRCNVLCPGGVDTEMLRKAYPNFKPPFQALDIARHIVFWLSPLSRPATGNVIPLQA